MTPCDPFETVDWATLDDFAAFPLGDDRLADLDDLLDGLVVTHRLTATASDRWTCRSEVVHKFSVAGRHGGARRA